MRLGQAPQASATTATTPLTSHVTVTPAKSITTITANPKNSRALKVERTIHGLKTDPERGSQMAQIVQLAKPFFHLCILDNPFDANDEGNSHQSSSIQAIIGVQTAHENLGIEALGVNNSTSETLIKMVCVSEAINSHIN